MSTREGEAVSDYTRVMKSYVWHEGQCYFVSTINRESSALLAPDLVYAETMVWKVNFDSGIREAIVHQAEGPRGSIAEHIAICQRLRATGNAAAPAEEES
jgi:hypothetical protein